MRPPFPPKLAFSAALIAGVCSALPVSAQSAVPTGLVTFFESASCPEGWTRPEYAKGRLLMFDTRTHADKPYGKSMAAGVAPKHDHEFFSAMVEVDELKVRGWEGCSNPTAAAAGRYNLVGPRTVGPSDHNLPFIHLVACEKQGKGAAFDALPVETYGFFNRAACPKEWEACGPPLCPEIAGRFAMPLMDGGTTGRTVGRSWPDARYGIHHHDLGGAFTPVGYGLTWAPWPVDFTSRAKGGERRFRGATHFPRNTDGSHGVLPYVRLLGCIKTGLVTRAGAGDVPEGMTLLHGGQNNCPSGWRETPGTAGRFVVASPEGAAPFQRFGSPASLVEDGERRTHSHSYQGDFVLKGPNICLNGGGDKDFAAAGTYPVTGRTDPSFTDPPFVQLRHCTFYPESDSVSDASSKPSTDRGDTP